MQFLACHQGCWSKQYVHPLMLIQHHQGYKKEKKKITVFILTKSFLSIEHSKNKSLCERHDRMHANPPHIAFPNLK